MFLVYLLFSINTSNNVNINTIDKDTLSALEVKTPEQKWDFINNECHGDVIVYERYIDGLVRDNPSLDHPKFIDEDVQGALDQKKLEQQEKARQHEVRLEQEIIAR